jgi:maleate isomerase
MSRVRIGMLTPSSNTVVEPITESIIHTLADVSAHYSRFKVTEISLSPSALAQFQMTPFLNAAELLADAKVDVIAWNGTSAAWRGFHEDEQLCASITAQFGMPATASMLALNEIMRSRGVRKFGLVTPYISEVQNRIVQNYAGAGFECVAERHSGIQVNFDFSEIADEHIYAQTREVAAAKPEAILIACTNLRAAPLVAQMEADFGVPIYDSTSAVVWRALALAKVQVNAAPQWGSLFAAAEP